MTQGVGKRPSVCGNYSDTDPKGFAQNRACSNLLISQMRKGRPESARTQPPMVQRRLAGHPSSRLPQVMQPRTHPGPRARQRPLTAGRFRDHSPTVCSGELSRRPQTAAPLCAVGICPGDLRDHSPTACSEELTSQKTSETTARLCAVETCPGDFRDTSPTVCRVELPRRPQTTAHCVQWRLVQETSGTQAPLCAVENCPGDLSITSRLEEL